MPTQQQIIDQFVSGPSGQAIGAQIERANRQQEIEARLVELRGHRDAALVEPQRQLAAAKERWVRASLEVEAASREWSAADRVLSAARRPFYLELTVLEQELKALTIHSASR